MAIEGELLKRITKKQASDVVHSSGYAKVNGSQFGAASTESFAARRAIDTNRTVIKSYADSEIARGAHNADLKAKQYTPESKTDTVSGSRFDRDSNRKQGSNNNSQIEQRRFGLSNTSVASQSVRSSRPPIPRRNPGISR